MGLSGKLSEHAKGFQNFALDYKRKIGTYKKLNEKTKTKKKHIIGPQHAIEDSNFSKKK